MEISHLEALEKSYHKIKNNPEKLQKQLNHIDNQDITVPLAEYKQKVTDRLRYVTAYKKYKRIIDPNNTYSDDKLAIHNDLIKELESIKTTDTLNNRDKTKAIMALKYLAIRLNTFTFFKNPKNVSQFCPQSPEEATNIFLPFDGTARDALGNNFLLWGIGHNLPPYALSYLVSCGISFNECNNNGETALHKAVDKSPEYIKFILQEKIECCTLQDLEALVHDKKILVFKELFKKTRKNEPIKDLKYTLKEYTKQINNQYITLETINAQDNHQYTALHKACNKKCIESAKLLLEAGADPNIKNNEHKNCIDILHTKPWDEQSTILAACIFNYHQALQKEYPELYNLTKELQEDRSNTQQITLVIQELINKKTQKTIKQKEIKKPTIQVNRTQENQITHAMQKPPSQCRYATQEGQSSTLFKKLKNYETLKKFLDKKCNTNLNVNVKHKGITPLKIALITHKIESTALLLERKADPNLSSHAHIKINTNSSKTECIELTPLEELSKLDRDLLKYIKLLAQYNADFGKTPYVPPLISMIYKQRLACESEQNETVSFILQQKNIDVNILNYFKQTALIAACEIKNTDIVKTLLQHKADPNLRAGNFYPIDSAYHQKAYEIIRLLLMNNATKMNLTIMVNQEKIALQNTQQKIKDILTKKHIITCKPNQTITIDNRPYDFFWHTLIHGTAYDMACFLKENNLWISDYNTHNAEYGYPLDYAINNNKTDFVTELLLNKISNTAQYTISSDNITQMCLQHIGTTKCNVIVNRKNKAVPCIYLKPKCNNFLFQDN